MAYGLREVQDKAFAAFCAAHNENRILWDSLTLSQRAFVARAFKAGWNTRKVAVDYALDDLAKADAPLISGRKVEHIVTDEPWFVNGQPCTDHGPEWGK